MPSREFELVSASSKVQLSTREAAEDSVVCSFFFVCLFNLLIISVCVVFLFCFVFFKQSEYTEFLFFVFVFLS